MRIYIYTPGGRTTSKHWKYGEIGINGRIYTFGRIPGKLTIRGMTLQYGMKWKILHPWKNTGEKKIQGNVNSF